MKKISITINDRIWEAKLNDSPTANAIYDALPFDGHAQIWGDEIYFSIPIRLEEDGEGREEVEVGDLAFWPVGSAFCIFFGRTPVSTSNKPRAYSPVNIFGKIEGDIEALKNVEYGSIVQVSKR